MSTAAMSPWWRSASWSRGDRPVPREEFRRPIADGRRYTLRRRSNVWCGGTFASPIHHSRKEALVKRSMVVLAVILLSVAVNGQRGGPSPEQQAALAKQDALEKSTPRLQITEEVLNLVVPGHTIGEAVGVAKNSKGSLFVFTRSGASGPERGSA